MSAKTSGFGVFFKNAGTAFFKFFILFMHQYLRSSSAQRRAEERAIQEGDKDIFEAKPTAADFKAVDKGWW